MRNLKTQLGLVVLAAALLCGCQKGNGLPTVPINGKINFGGGPPPASGMITFTPSAVKEGLPRRPGRAGFGTDGVFKVTSFSEGDGLIPGTYGATVTCWSKPPDSSDPASSERNSYVPKDFQAPPVVVNETDNEVAIVIDVPKKQ